MSGLQRPDPSADSHSAGQASRANGVARTLAELRQIPAWARRNPLRALITGSVIVVLPASLMLAAVSLLPAKAEVAPTVADALQALDSGELPRARELALRLRANPDLSYADQGSAMYVLGSALESDAQAQTNPRARRMLHLVAARYLQEAQGRGQPAGRDPQALVRLGRNWLLAAEFERAIPFLLSALELNPPPGTEIRRLLAEAYLFTTPSQPDKARIHNAAVLAEEGLPNSTRHEALLRAAEIALALHDFKAGHEALSSLPVDDPRTTICKAELLLAESDHLLATDTNQRTQSAALVAAATTAIERLSDASHPDLKPSIVAQYLLGVCLARQGDQEAAIEQFAQVRRGNGQSPEQVAAALRAMEVHTKHNRFTEAVELAEKACLEAEQLINPRSHRLPLGEVQACVGRLHTQLLAAGEFELALQLGELPPGEIPAWQLVTWNADAYQSRAFHVKEAQLSGPQHQEALLAARANHRQAGRELAKLAELRQLSGEHTNDLWNSAQQFALGHDYRSTVNLAEKYLQQESQKRRPEALLLLAESELALGDMDRAMESLTECLESYSKHPAAYQARVIAAHSSAERGLLSEARDLLMQNVTSDELAPQADAWRNSLFLLGKLLHREGTQWDAKSREVGIDSDEPERVRTGFKHLEQASEAFRKAIVQLSKAIERYPDSPQSAEAHYLLADSYRQSAKWPRKQSQSVSIEATRAALARQSQQDLEAAVTEFDKLIVQLANTQETAPEADLRRRILRNSYFAKGDVLFELGRHEEAVKACSATTSRYQNDPESLNAYVQMAACYRQLKKPGEARGTLTQAQAVLARMKPDVEFTRTTPYTREEWQQLLTWLARL